MEKRLEIPDLPDALRELVGACELTGKRTIFQRDGRPIAVLASYDEYIALRETVDVANDAALRARIESADEEIRRGKMILPEDLFVE